MQNVLNLSAGVDRLRASSGSALKSLQKSFEETALKAAGLGDDEEALYKLGKHTQTYLRAVDAMQQAAATLADDFSEAMEDLELRKVARKFRDAQKSTSTQQLAALSKELDKPIKEACDAGSNATRQKLIGRAFEGLLDVNIKCFRAVSASHEEAFTKAQQLLKEEAKPSAALGRQPPASAPQPSAPTAPPSAHRIDRRATTGCIPDVHNVSASAPLDDLLDFGGASSAKGSDTKGATNLLDFDDFGGSHGTNGTSSPPQRASTNSFDDFGSIHGSGFTSTPQRASTTSSIPMDFDFNSPGPAAPSPSNPSNGYSGASPLTTGGSSFGLDTMSWPTKENEDESCIKARVELWQQGKNIRTMLCSLHEVAPACSGWTPVKFDDLDTPSDVKVVYRKAVLAVHPDKHNDKGGEKILGDLVFKALREQWSIFQKSS